MLQELRCERLESKKCEPYIYMSGSRDIYNP
jgi:hypothetical protein